MIGECRVEDVDIIGAGDPEQPHTRGQYHDGDGGSAFVFRTASAGLKHRSKKLRDAEIPCDDAQYGEDDERHGHGMRGFMDMACMVRVDMRRAPKCDEDQPEAVERRQ